MGWFDWVRETAGKVTTAVKTGLRGVIELPEEIEPEIVARPATLEQIEEALEEAVYAERFIQEVVPDEAIRLARGVQFYEPLTNVACMRHWTAQDITQIKASADYQISVRAVLVAPDGQMTYVDVAFPTGEAFSWDEFTRRAASALDDDFVNQYEEVGRSQMVRSWNVAMEPYIQRFKPLL